MGAYCLFVEAPGAFSGKPKPGPGDFGFKPPLLATSDPELRARRLNAELANGRLAMMAIIGMFFQDGLTGSAWGDWALYTDSPLRAESASVAHGGVAALRVTGAASVQRTSEL